MSIRVECPSCRAKFSVADRHSGKRGRCPHCNEALTVPFNDDAVEIIDDAPPAKAFVRTTPPRPSAAPASSQPQRAPERSQPKPAQPVVKSSQAVKHAEILQALEGSIERVRPTPLYRFWIGVVAGIMVLLPVLYVGMICAASAGILWYVGNMFGGAGKNKNSQGAVLTHLPLVILGITFVGFMLKPFFARRSKSAEPLSLDPEKESFLYQFVDGVCQTVGAPTPVRIDVDSQVNASAHIDGGLFASGRNLVLTIGLPLAAGLDLRQFTGVLAHEFGHFSQSAGMQLSRLIRSVNFWFARVVYERDSFDETLLNWSHRNEVFWKILGAVVRAAVWLTRRILWLLMMFGHLVSGFLSRQMEFDADRYQTRMVGSDTLAATMERIGVLATAQTGAFNDVAENWRARRLPDNLPRLIVANVEQIPPEVCDKLKQDMETGKTGLFDTHPADRERIVSSLREDSDGIFQLTGPTTILFRNFDETARKATFDYYRSVVGSEVRKEQLVPVNEAIQESLVSLKGNEAHERFFLPDFTRLRSLSFPSEFPRAPADLKATKESLIVGRRTIEKNYPGYKQWADQWVETNRQLFRADSALTWIETGGRVHAADFCISRSNTRSAREAIERAEEKLQKTLTGLKRYEQVMMQRLFEALSMLNAPVVRERVEHGADLLEEAKGLFPYIVFLHRQVLDAIEAPLRTQNVLEILLSQLSENPNDNPPSLHEAIFRSLRRFREELKELRSAIGETTPYPFEHAQGDISLSKYVLPFIPDVESWGDLLGFGSAAVERVVALSHRILGRLAVGAEAVELSLGLPPISIEKKKPSRQKA